MEFIKWFWNAGELLMFLGVGIIVIGFFVKKKQKKTEKENTKK